jgi:hypothetical protein
MEKSSNFFDVKVGDKVITKLKLGWGGDRPEMCVRTVTKVYKKYFVVPSYDSQDEAMAPCFMMNGRRYGRQSLSRFDHTPQVWTQEIQDEFDALMATWETRKNFRLSIEQSVLAINKLAGFGQDNATLSYLDNLLKTVVSDPLFKSEEGS